MGAIFRREFKSYFISPIGYIFLAAFYIYSGAMFSAYSLSSGYTKLDNVFGSLIIILLVIIPILTMRTIADEKRTKTDQCLLTAPVSLGGIVFGKFLAAFLIYIIGIAITVVFAVVVSVYGAPDWNVIVGNILALALLGGAYIAVGIFCSALTENQVVAAVAGFFSLLAISFLSVLGTAIPFESIATQIAEASMALRVVVIALASLAVGGLTGVFSKQLVNGIVAFAVSGLVISLAAWKADKIPYLFNKLSLSERYYTFTGGIFDFSNILFFLSVIAAFLFFTVRVLEKRRWS